MDLSSEGHVYEWQAFTNSLVGDDAVMELVSGSQMTVCRYTINNKMTVAEHSHEYEQITYVLEGEMRFTVDGKTVSMKAGDVQVIPSNLKHSAEIIGTPFRTVESFHPARRDFLAGN